MKGVLYINIDILKTFEYESFVEQAVERMEGSLAATVVCFVRK